MGKIVEKKKKKKGRPSLLDLQKRSLREQQQQQNQQTQTQKRNPNPNSHFSTPNPNRNHRFNPNSDLITTDSNPIDAEEGDSSDTRKEKKLKFVLRLPSNQVGSVNSTSLNSGSYVSDSNAEDDNAETQLKKRKINAVADRSAIKDGQKEEKRTDNLSGTQIESTPTTPLPDGKLLVFILDRLQKKDTYGVFSEPVDPKELPDYHEIIQHPMDFGTVRKNLFTGAYTYLEQLERDVLLICSNAMRYNAPDTIYFRQARSIQELAKRDFENLRRESDDDDPRPKVVRRGRPPTKNLKKYLGGTSFERAGSEFSSDATLATCGDNTVWSNSYDLKKGLHPERSGSAEAVGRTSYRTRNGGSYNSWLAENKSEGNEDFPASVLKGVKFGKKIFVVDENRRNTYKQSLSSICGHEATVLTTFDGEKKQLMAVGVHMEYSFARSLARFAATLGPVAWKIASKKIERALPAGIKFGPGWVGEREAPSSEQLQLTPSLVHSFLPRQLPSLAKMSSLVTGSKKEPSDDPPSDVHLDRTIPASTVVSSSSLVSNISHEPSKEHVEPTQVLSCQARESLLNNGGAGMRLPIPFRINQSPLLKNGISGNFGCSLVSQSQQKVKTVQPDAFDVGSSSGVTNSKMLSIVSGNNNNVVQSMHANCSELDDTKLPESVSTVNSTSPLDDCGHEPQAGAQMLVCSGQPGEEGLSQQQKSDSVPPDLNVRFLSPGSPGSTPQPDLVLQL